MIGTCLQLRSSSISNPHYWFIVLGPYKGHYFCANATDAKEKSDRSCVLLAGCHPQITKESVIHYRLSKLFPAAKLEAEVRAETNFRVYSSCSPEVVKQILDGALVSDLLPNDILKWLQEATGSGG
jgi:hypothetical protein